VHTTPSLWLARHTQYARYVYVFRSLLQLVAVDAASGTLTTHGVVDHASLYNRKGQVGERAGVWVCGRVDERVDVWVRGRVCGRVDG
jgi:hypothetical protein